MIFIGALVLNWKVSRLIGTVVSWFCISLNLVEHIAQESNDIHWGACTCLEGQAFDWHSGVLALHIIKLG